MTRPKAVALTGAVAVAAVGAVAVTQLGVTQAPRGIGAAAAIGRGTTGLHGPNGEPCVRTLAIPGKHDPGRYVFTRTAKGVVYTTVIDGLTHYAAGTKPPPAVTVEHVCAYKPKGSK